MQIVKKMMCKKRILVVEDNPDDEAMMRFALQKAQVPTDIVVCRDGQAALDYLFDEAEDKTALGPPHLILLDIKLPRLNGIEVLRRIRADRRTSLIPVVMLTTSDEQQDRLHSYELRANSFLRKPVDFDKFVEIIRHTGLYWLVLNEDPPQMS